MSRDGGALPPRQKLEDVMQKLATIGFEVIIITLICVSVLSSQPAFKTTQTPIDPATIALIGP
jgi:hypothetical protein